MLTCINRDKIKIDDTSIVFSVLNTAESNKIDSLKEKITEFLNNMGYKDITISCVISEEERKKFIEEVEKEEEEKKEEKKEIKLIKGKNIFKEPSEIRNLITNENNVVIIAQVFGM